MDQVIAILYTVTVLLKVPVGILVLLALGWALFECGRLLREMRDRKRTSPTVRAGDWVELERLRDPSLADEDLTVEFELIMAARLSVLKVGLRMGPVLGLMGTLIPMGPALMSVSTGDLVGMSSDFIIAFSTTVAGLLVGALSYIMLVVRQNWYARDMAELDRQVRRIGGGRL